jgi:hypothetical protein
MFIHCTVDPTDEKKMLVLTRFPSIMAIEYVDNLDPLRINVKHGIWAFPAINSAHYKQND